MNSTESCPDSAKLKELLDGTLSENEQTELNYHLETCPSCQHALEGLVAGKESWSGAAEQLSQSEQGPEAGLKRVMEEIKSQGPDKQAEADAPPGEEIALDFLSPAENPEHLGRLGHYDVLEVIGRGGMGVVLKAFDSVLHRIVAIKVLAPQLATSSAARKRFERESRAAAAVSHEHIVAIHAVEETKGLPYLVMEYIAGVSLQERLDRTGPQELKEILRIGMQTARGLAAAHAQGLVHRDIKPANILLHNGVERVKITDFGLARAIDDASTTQSGYVAGTPQYMAPEQARGETVDHRADLFSLGSVLYALCTGRPPFRASTTMAVLKRVSEESPQPLTLVNPEIPLWLVAIIEKLHAKNPAERFQSARELADLLGERLAQVQGSGKAVEPRTDQQPNSGPRLGHPVPRFRWLKAAVLFLPLIAGGLVLTEATGLTQIKQWAATVLRISTSQGTLIVEVDDPQVQVTIDGEEMAIHGAGPQEIRVKPGEHRIQAMKDGKPVPVDNDLVTITRGGKQIVRVRREGAIEPLEGAKDQTQFQAIPLNQLDAKAVYDNLTKLFDVKNGQGPTFDLDKPRNIILVRGTTEQVETVKDILKQLGEHASSTGGVNPANPVASSSKIGGDQAKGAAPAVRRLDSPNLSTPYKIEPFHVLKVNVLDVDPNHPIHVGNYLVEPDGKIDLGLPYRKIKVSGLTLEEAEETVRNYLKGLGFRNPMVSLSLAGWVPKWLGDPGMRAPYRIRPLQLLNVSALDVDPSHQLGGEYLIEPSGKINFGPAYGRVPLAGLTLEEAQNAIEKHLRKLGFANPIVSVTLAGWQKDWHDLMKQDPGTDSNPHAQTGAVGQKVRVQSHGAGPEVAAKLRAELEAYPDYIASLMFTPDGKTLATLGKDHSPSGNALVKFWNPATAKGIRSRCVLGEPPGVFTTDAGKLALYNDLKAVRILELAAGRGDKGTVIDQPVVLRCLSFAPDGQTLAIGSEEGRITLWQTALERRLHMVIHHPDVWCLCFSPDGKTLFSGGQNSSVLAWDVVSGNCMAVMNAHLGIISALAVSPDGRVLASGSFDRTIKLWDLAKGTEIATLAEHKNAILALAFSADDRLLASACQDGTVKLWRIGQTKSDVTLEAHTGPVRCLAFSPDGKILASGGQDRLVKLWEVSFSNDRRAKDQAATKPAEQQLPEAKVRRPKEIEAVPSQQYTGRLTAPQGDPIGLTFEMDERTLLHYQRLLKQHPVKGTGSPLYVGLVDEKGFPHQGTLTAMNEQVNPATGTVQIHGSLPNPGRVLLPGMFIRVRMPLGPPQKVLAVPEEAVLTDQGQHYVLVVNDKDIVERGAVTRGAAEGKMRIIDKGLNATDRVVVGGVGKVTPSTLVKALMVGD